MTSRPPQFDRAERSAGPAPLRRPGSVRRTTTIDSHWPDGGMAAWVMTGAARDVLTPMGGGDPVVLAQGGFTITCSPMREILSLDVIPGHPRAAELVGVRAGGASREALQRTMGDLRGTPTFQLLDDFAGASLVARWVWSLWQADWMAQARAAAMQANMGRGGTMENVCTGFATGSSALTDDGLPSQADQLPTYVGPLENPEDPCGWHPLKVQTGPEKRRARRIDVWREGDLLHVDAGFQDSGATPDGRRAAIHEYRVHAEVDPRTMELVALQALPLILPFRECPGAAIKASRLVGTPIGALREAVIAALPGPMGCTHLNDVLRALADVPVLAESLPA